MQTIHLPVTAALPGASRAPAEESPSTPAAPAFARPSVTALATDWRALRKRLGIARPAPLSASLISNW